jgi:hypothetical protein
MGEKGGGTVVGVIGERYGRLTIVGEGYKEAGRNYLKCQCDCGRPAYVLLANLKQGTRKSCGCSRERPINPETRMVEGEHLRLANQFYRILDTLHDRAKIPQTDCC